VGQQQDSFVPRRQEESSPGIETKGTPPTSGPDCPTPGAFRTSEGVIAEAWRLLRIRDAHPDQDAFVYGPVLQSNDPWPAAFSAMDRALLEDAKRVHYRKLMEDIAYLASTWKDHTERCSTWVSEIAAQVLDVSKMNPYQPTCTPPFVNHLRLAVWIYRRLFHLPTNVLHQSNQGQYWSIEGAPDVPSVIGVSTVAMEDQNTMLLQAIEKISVANRERAFFLQRESKIIAQLADSLRSSLEYEIAKKRIGVECGLVKFFSWEN
jgi:hypothetical protein